MRPMNESETRRGSLGAAFGLELLVGLMACLCLGAFAWLQWKPAEELTFVDRPRDEAATPDFVVRYLDATKTPYRLDQGFIRLKIHRKTDVQLRGLLSSLGTYIDLLQEDRQMIVSRRTSASQENHSIERRTAQPTEDGRLAITSHAIEWSDDVWQELDQLIQSLESQYREVAEALRHVDRNVVVPARYTPVEPEPSLPTASSARPTHEMLPRVGQTRSTARLASPTSLRPASAREAGANTPEKIEMIDDSSAGQLQRLGN
ncbi:hypothetical protein K2X85_20410 [bacterium]|nr:hypothetical protein [bacterium]